MPGMSITYIYVGTSGETGQQTFAGQIQRFGSHWILNGVGLSLDCPVMLRTQPRSKGPNRNQFEDGHLPTILFRHPQEVAGAGENPSAFLKTGSLRRQKIVMNIRTSNSD